MPNPANHHAYIELLKQKSILAQLSNGSVIFRMINRLRDTEIDRGTERERERERERDRGTQRQREGHSEIQRDTETERGTQ